MLLLVSPCKACGEEHFTNIHMIAYESFRTVGSLLLTNPDFRLFVTDLSTIGRQVLADSAHTLSGAAEKVGQKLELSEQEQKTIQGAGADDAVEPLLRKDESRRKCRGRLQSDRQWCRRGG